MKPDAVFLRRLVALLASVTSVVALVGTGLAVGEAVAPWAGWLVVLLVSGTVAVRVGIRVLDDRVADADREFLGIDPIKAASSNGRGDMLTMPDRPQH